MKKIFYLFAIFLGTIIVGCNPMEDIHNDAKANDPGVVQEVQLILTDDDYDELGLQFGSFNSVDDAKSMLPDLLADKYPYLSDGSSVLVGFNLYVGNAFGIRDYNLDQEDYTFSGSDGLGFNFDANPEDYLADILSTNVTNAKEGDYRLAKYFQYTGDFGIVTPTVTIDENFDYGTTAGDLTSITTDWTAHSGAGNGLVGYAAASLSMANYPSTDVGGSLTFSAAGSEDVNRAFTPITSGKVYASALVNLSAVSTGNYFFHFIGDFIVFDQFRARVGAKDDGSGKILFGIGAESSTLTYGSTPFDLNTTYLLVASYDLATGTANLYILTSPDATEPQTPEATNTGLPHTLVKAIAVRQSGGIPNGTLDGIRVANTWSAIMSNASLPDETIGDKTAGEKFYEFDGTTWVAPSNKFYAITDEDFDSMGIPNFGSSISPDNYLTAFLTLKYPYAQEDDVRDIAYKYVSSSSGPGTRGNRYTFLGGVWTAYESTIATALQFGLEDGVWVPDNTIRYTFTTEDYTFVGETLKTEPGFENAAANLLSYGNFNRQGGTTGWSTEMMVTAIGIVLDNIDPSAAEGQKYLVTVDIYNSGNGTENYSLIKTGGEWVAN